MVQLRPTHEQLIHYRITGAKTYGRGIYLVTATGATVIDTSTGSKQDLGRIKGWVPRTAGKGLWE